MSLKVDINPIEYPIEKVRDYHKCNEGIDEKDALIHCLDKSIISEYEYDLIYPIVMGGGLYSQEW